MYSAKVLAHLENPRHVGALIDATTQGVATNPVCGDVLHLYLKVEADWISSASFQVQGCPPSIAAGSALTELLTGSTLDAARALEPADIKRALDGLPRNKEHCAVLAIDALRAALAQPQRSQRSAEG